MAISQKLVDPHREFKVSVRYSWQKSYHAALLENDWTKMVELVQKAESELNKRRQVLICWLAQQPLNRLPLPQPRRCACTAGVSC